MKRILFLLIVLCFSMTVFSYEGKLPVIKTKTKKGVFSIHDIGEYSAVPWQKPDKPIEPGSEYDRKKGLNFSMAVVNLHSIKTEAQMASHIKRCNNYAKWGRQQGKKLILRLDFWNTKARVFTPIRDGDVDMYWEKIDALLGSLNVEDLAGITLSEESLWHSGRPELLNELYKRVKAKYNIMVFQWYQCVVPEYRMDSDGWVTDFYFTGGKKFRRMIQQHLVMGKPVIVMPWASYYDPASPARVTNKTTVGAAWMNGPWSAEVWQVIEDQLQVCREYNLPTLFFWVYWPKSTRRASTGHFAMKTNTYMDKVTARVLAWVEEVNALPVDYKGLPSADISEGGIIELAPRNTTGTLLYSESFKDSTFIFDADIEGFRNLLWEKSRMLTLRSWDGQKPRATLTYKFKGAIAARYPKIELAIPYLANGSKVTISVSTDGKTWFHKTSTRRSVPQKLRLSTSGNRRFASVNNLYARVEMVGELCTGKAVAKIDDLRINTDFIMPEVSKLVQQLENPNKLVYKDSFDSQKYRFCKIKDARTLGWSRGQLDVRMRPGGSKPSLTWHIKSDKPAQNILINVTGKVNVNNRGTNWYLDVSLDNKSWSYNVDSTKQKLDRNGWAKQGLVIDLSGKPEYTGVSEFFVRLRLTAQGYKKVHHSPSGIVDEFKIEAEVVTKTAIKTATKL